MNLYFFITPKVRKLGTKLDNFEVFNIPKHLNTVKDPTVSDSYVQWFWRYGSLLLSFHRSSFRCIRLAY